MLPTLHLEFERWKYNENEGVYVSNMGRVKDCHRKIVEPRVQASTGYFIVLTEKGLRKVHRLVMETWAGASDLTVDHIDSNKRNNKLSNLEYVSEEENLKRAREKLIVISERKLENPSTSYACWSADKGEIKFSSSKKAINWLKNCTGYLRNTKEKNEDLLSMIEAAIADNKMFCDYYWKKV